MSRDFLVQDKMMEAGLAQTSPPRMMTRLQRYEEQKRMHEQQIALLDEAIAALKSNPEVERIINLLDRL